MSPDSSPPAPSRSTPLSMYAEYLPKLGRLSVVVHLPSPSTRHTRARIISSAAAAADASSRLVVTHEGVVSELRLPVRMSLHRDGGDGEGEGEGEYVTALPGGGIPPGLDKMSWGLRPDATGPAGPRVGGAAGAAEDVRVPWSAADLVARRGGGGGGGGGDAVVESDVVCRRCGAVVVGRERLGVWKDLPSENWAEMMEFWHCHKPTTTTTTTSTNGHDKRTDLDVGNGTTGQGDKASEEALASRGYGANSAIVAQVGVGFVDLTKMLFHVEDCRCVMATGDEEENHPPKPIAGLPAPAASCPGCGTQLGHFDTRKDGVSLFKWKLNLAADDGPAPDPPTLSQCLAAALVANQARSGSAKVVLQGETEAITIWILNPHIKFSSYVARSSQQQHHQTKTVVAAATAMKLLYQDEAVEDEDEIDLPDEAIQEIRQTLQEGSGYLPPDERTKQFGPKGATWTVTLLERAGP